MSNFNPDIASKVAKLTALATSPNQHEALLARTKALDLVASIDLTLLDTLNGQREKLLTDLDAEHRRLWNSGSRPTKTTTEELIRRCILLFNHYRRNDCTYSIIQLLNQDVHLPYIAPDRDAEGSSGNEDPTGIHRS